MLLPWIPLILTAVIVRCYALRIWGTDPEARRGFHFKGASLVASTWPVYSLAFFSTLARVRIPFLPTPKTAGSPTSVWLLAPQATMTFILATAVVWRLLHWAQAPMPATLALGLVDIGVHWMLIPAWLQGRLGLAEPSDRVMVKPMEADVRSDSSVGS